MDIRCLTLPSPARWTYCRAPTHAPLLAHWQSYLLLLCFLEIFRTYRVFWYICGSPHALLHHAEKLQVLYINCSLGDFQLSYKVDYERPRLCSEIEQVTLGHIRINLSPQRGADRIILRLENLLYSLSSFLCSLQYKNRNLTELNKTSLWVNIKIKKKIIKKLGLLGGNEMKSTTFEGG